MILSRKNTKDKDTEYIAVSPQDKKYSIKNPFSEEIMINHKKVDIKIFDDENGFTYIVYKRKKYLAEIVEKSQNKYTVLINGVSYSFTIETPISYKRKKYLEKNKSKSRIQLIRSPMPGKILEVIIEAGAEVKEGEPLLILEAMKMQNEINSSYSGKITKVFVHEGDIVNKEDVLIEIEQ
jgi:biotin carboxyl carrier protein